MYLKFSQGWGYHLVKHVFIVLGTRPLVQSPIPNTPLVHLNLEKLGLQGAVTSASPGLVIKLLGKLKQEDCWGQSSGPGRETARLYFKNEFAKIWPTCVGRLSRNRHRLTCSHGSSLLSFLSLCLWSLLQSDYSLHDFQDLWDKTERSSQLSKAAATHTRLPRDPSDSRDPRENPTKSTKSTHRTSEKNSVDKYLVKSKIPERSG